jgi:hypothetical protein
MQLRWRPVHTQAMIGVKESSGSETSRLRWRVLFHSTYRRTDRCTCACYVFPADTIFFGNLSIRAFTYPVA